MFLCRNLAKTLWTYTCPNHWTKNEAVISVYQLGKHIERSERAVFSLTGLIGICPIGLGEVSSVRIGTGGSDGSLFMPALQPLKLPVEAPQNQSIKQAGDQPKQRPIERLLDVSEHRREKQDQHDPPAESGYKSEKNRLEWGM